MNINGLITTVHPQDKINLLRETMDEEKPLLLALTETWLHDHKEAEVHIENYNLFRKDRPVRSTFGRGRHVGGVALYVNSSWLPDSMEILGYSNAVVDILVIHSKRENIIIAVLYRQPENRNCKQSIYRSTYKDFEEPLNKLNEVVIKHKNSETEILIMGDFNMPSADWDTNSHIEGALEDQRKLVASTQDFCEKFILQQIISTSTHQKGNTLDLVFTNTPEKVHSQVARETALSDHYIVLFHMNRTEKSIKVSENSKNNDSVDDFHMLNFKNEEIDWEELGKSCITDWKKMLEGKTTREMKSVFYDHCLKKSHDYVPKKLRPSTKRKKCIPKYYHS